MQNQQIRTATSSLLAACALVALTSVHSAFAQGALTPPGAPAPTMKTLAQIEPRTPLSAPFTITQPGSYYLTTNIFVASGNAITINTNDVTLDLNGFVVTAGTAGQGVAVPNAQRNVSVHSGVVRNCPAGGIIASLITGGSFTDLVVSENGVGGIAVGVNCVVQNCTVVTNVAGISVANGSWVTHCTLYNNGSGISAGSFCTIAQCLVSSCTTGTGIATGPQSTVRECMSMSNFGNGIAVTDDCRVTDNECSYNGANGSSYGINVANTWSRIEGNHMVDNVGSRNLKVASAPNWISRNTVGGGGFSVAVGNLAGPLLSTSSAVSTNSNPNANYSF